MKMKILIPCGINAAQNSESIPCAFRPPVIQKMTSKKLPLVPWKMLHQKKNKCEYPLRQKKSHFWKICPSIHTHVLYPRQYNRTRFYQKNIDEITILHRNPVCFSSFFKITICKPNLMFQTCSKNDMKYPCKVIFFLL